MKEPKYYFYDVALINNDNSGAKLENLVANALLKELHRLEDIYGKTTKLHYLRMRDGREIDFLAVIDNQPTYLIEAKWSDGDANKNFFYFDSYLPATVKKIQLVKELDREKTYPNGMEVRALVPWLTDFDFHKN